MYILSIIFNVLCSAGLLTVLFRWDAIRSRRRTLQTAAPMRDAEFEERCRAFASHEAAAIGVDLREILAVACRIPREYVRPEHKMGYLFHCHGLLLPRINMRRIACLMKKQPWFPLIRDRIKDIRAPDDETSVAEFIGDVAAALDVPVHELN